MKKFLLLLGVFSIFLSSAFAKVPSNSKVIVVPLLENVSEYEEPYLASFAANRLQANLNEYTSFVFINHENKKEILNLQKESERAIYDQSQGIELGKMVNADYVLFLTITKLEKSFAVHATFTNIQSGIDEVTTSSFTRSSSEEIADTYGCAIDELTIALCDDLGINLTATNKHILLNGEIGLSESEKISKYKADEQKYLERQRELDNEIRLLSSSTEVDAAVIAKNLAAEKKLNEERLNYVRAKQKKLDEKADRDRDDKIKDLKRSEEQKQKLELISKALSDKLSTVKVTTESFISKITYVESIKQKFEEISQSIMLNCDSIIDDAEAEIAKKQAEIDARPLRNVETTQDGEMTYTAKTNREKEIKDYRDYIYVDANKSIALIEKNGEAQQKYLVRDIEKGYQTFKKKTITTLGEELVVDISEYDGNKYGWDLFVTIQSDDVIIFETKSFLTYKSVTGHKPCPDATDANYERYVNEVDYYESLFQRKEPVFTFALDVKIEPLPKNCPSQYAFYFEDFRYYDTLKVNENGKFTAVFPIDKLHLRNSYKEHQMMPSYDIRTKSDFEKEEKELLEAQKEELRDKEKIEEKRLARKRQAKAKQDRDEEAKSRDYLRNLFTVNYTMMPTQMKNSSLGFEYSKGFLGFTYIRYNFDFFDIRDKNITYYPSDPNSNFNPMVSNMLSLGINIHFGRVFQVYGGYGVGANMAFPTNFFGDLASAQSIDKYLVDECKADFTHGFHVGVSLEPIRHFVTTLAYQQTYMFNSKYNYGTINVGLGYMW